ncbi:FixH family protein [Bacillus sp. AK031]
MKKLLALFILIGSLILAACGNQEENHEEHGDGHMDEGGELTTINAELSVPETAEPGEKVVFNTHVTKGEENITDATEVKYEVWMDGNKEDSEMIEAEHGEEGNYSAEKTFTEDGVYYVQVHVTANDMHTMPKTQIAVGEAEIAQESDSEEKHHHEHGEVSIHLMKRENVQAGAQTELTASIEQSESPLTEAQVRYEIWLEGQEGHEWVDTEESEEGTYKGMYKFTEKGMYYITVHVENDEGVHEHIEEMITVQ